MNRIKLVTVMILWGSIGLFTRYIPLTPIHLAFSRAVLGAILLVVISGRKSGALKGVNRTTLLLYSISGALIGLAWVKIYKQADGALDEEGTVRIELDRIKHYCFCQEYVNIGGYDKYGEHEYKKNEG